MKTFKVGFTYLDQGYVVIPEAEDADIARVMALELLKELPDSKVTSVEEYDSPQEAVESFAPAIAEGNKYVN